MDNFKEIFNLLANFIEEREKIRFTLYKETVEENAKDKLTFSPNQKLLVAALAKARAEMAPLVRDGINGLTDGSFDTLSGIQKVITNPLSVNKLAITHDLQEINDKTYLTTYLMHDSGEWRKTSCRITVEAQDLDTFESIINKLKRINIKCLLSIASQGDKNDDDGVLAMKVTRDNEAKGTALNHNVVVADREDCINAEQLDELVYELREFPDMTEKFLKTFKIKNLADLPFEQYRAAMNNIRRIKKLRKDKGE